MSPRAIVPCRAVFEHSWQLLAPVERDVLKRLAIFAGGFRMDAAVQAAGASRLILASLVEKSLLSVTTGERYALHELLRQFAGEKLGAVPADQTETHNRHSAYYLAFLHDREQALTGFDQQKALAAIGEEIENVRVAWNWAVAQGDFAILAHAVEGLYHFYQIRGRYHEGVELLTQAGRQLRATLVPEEAQSSPLLQRMLARCGALNSSLGRVEPAQQCLAESLQIARRLNRPAENAFCLLYLGEVAHWHGRYPEAKALFLESLALSRSIGDDHGVADTLNKVTEMVMFLDVYAEVQQMAQECLTISRQIGRPDWISKALDTLGAVAFYTGAYAESETYYQEVLVLSKEIGDQLGIAFALGGLAWLTWARDGNHAEARRLAEESLIVAQECGHTFHIGTRRAILGQILIACGDYAEAERCHHMALAIGQSFSDAIFTTISLAGLGDVRWRLGDFVGSRRYLLAALRTASAAQAFSLVGEAMVYYATLLVHESALPLATKALDKQLFAVELLALLVDRPLCWQVFRERAALLMAELEAELPADAVVAAKQRGRKRTLQATVAEILQGSGVEA